MALNRLWIPSPCYSSRGGSSVRLIVLHTAEGARTIEDLGHFFQNGANQVSSHTGADDKRGTIGEYVTRGNKAWTAANYNPAAVQLELCGFASWSNDEWRNKHSNMLYNCADWIREEADKFGLPITRLNASQAQGNGRGVCQHIDLGAGGGGHVDCGSGFPMDYVLDLARGQAAKPQEPKISYEEKDNDMVQLQFDRWGSATIVIPRYFRDGKGDIFIAGRGEKARVAVTFLKENNQQTSKEWEGIDTNGDARRWDIPKDCRVAYVYRDNGDKASNPDEIWSMCFSHE